MKTDQKKKRPESAFVRDSKAAYNKVRGGGKVTQKRMLLKPRHFLFPCHSGRLIKLIPVPGQYAPRGRGRGRAPRALRPLPGIGRAPGGPAPRQPPPRSQVRFHWPRAPPARPASEDTGSGNPPARRPAPHRGCQPHANPAAPPTAAGRAGRGGHSPTAAGRSSRGKAEAAAAPSRRH